MYRVTAYKYGFDPAKLAQNNKDKKPKIRKVTEDSIQRSVRRTKSVIYDYMMCNDFDYFVTFTFDPKKVNRYDPLVCYLKMQSWLHRQSRKYDNFKYIIVPEFHKDGAIHFHAPIAGYEGAMKKTNVIHEGKRVFNVTGFRFGFTTATKVDDRQKASAYLTKYITKDMQLVNNKKRYWSSRNLIKPTSLYNKIYDLGIQNLLKPKNVIYETDYNVIYEVPKVSLSFE